MQNKEYWENIYQTKETDLVSWFQVHAEISLQFIHSTKVKLDAPIIDVGGGASTLVDDLLNDGFSNITVLDLSGEALNKAKNRLGALASKVNWIEADVTEASLPDNFYDVWHDRAVFHFLTSVEERLAYVEQVRRSVKLDGHVIIATFAEDGPTKCSGLPVMRYSVGKLQAEFGSPFSLVAYTNESHRTPFGAVQQFLYCHFKLMY